MPVNFGTFISAMLKYFEIFVTFQIIICREESSCHHTETSRLV